MGGPIKLNSVLAAIGIAAPLLAACSSDQVASFKSSLQQITDRASGQQVANAGAPGQQGPGINDTPLHNLFADKPYDTQKPFTGQYPRVALAVIIRSRRSWRAVAAVRIPRLLDAQGQNLDEPQALKTWAFQRPNPARRASSPYAHDEFPLLAGIHADGLRLRRRRHREPAHRRPQSARSPRAEQSRPCALLPGGRGKFSTLAATTR